MELDRELIRCMRCGACRSVCPVFAELEVESSVARGKMSLVEALAAGELGPTAYLYRLLTRCAGCRACVENCPSGVAVYDILLEARARMCRGSAWDRVRKFAVRQSFQRPGLMPWAIRMSAMAARLWPGLGSRLSLPTPNRFPRPQGFHARPPAGGGGPRVAYFPGCLTDHYYPGIIEAMAALARAAGFELLFPQRETCCGAPFAEMGDPGRAAELADRCLAEFEDQGCESVLFTCATCGHHLKEHYRGPLALEDATAWLVRNGFEPRACGFGGPAVTYHDPCHLARGLGVRDAPRMLIRGAGWELREMEDADRCCGSGGEFNVVHGGLSAAIRDRKLDAVERTGASIVATCCPGCAMHIAEGADARGWDVRVVHPVELAAWVPGGPVGDRSGLPRAAKEDYQAPGAIRQYTDSI